MRMGFPPVQPLFTTIGEVWSPQRAAAPAAATRQNREVPMTLHARHVDRARSLARTDPAAAVMALQELRRRYPRNPRPAAALRDLARQKLDALLPPVLARARAGDWAGALQVLAPVAGADPANAGLAALAAEGLIATGRIPAALRLLAHARGHAPQDPALAALEGAARRAGGDSVGALAPLRAALERDPGHAAAGNSYGLALLDLGDRAGAAAAWRQVVKANPRAADSWLNLSRLADFTAEPALAAALEAAAALDGLGPAERECLDFARAEAALQAGDGDGAFAHLHRANAARRRTLGYDRRRDAALFAGIAARLADLPGPPAPPPAAGAPRPILITGLPRSGTTLTERILAAHPGVHPGGEMDALTRAIRPLLAPDADTGPGVLARIAAPYRAALAEAAGRSPVITDKMPLNFRWIGPVLAALPEARVVHLTRDPMAVGFSLYRLRFSGRGNGFAYDLGDIGAYVRQERALMRLWRDRWGPERLLMLDYQALTAEPETQIRRLLDFCGLDFDAACLAPHETQGPVLTASAAQVREPIRAGSGRKWRPFAAHLAPLAAALTDPDAPGIPPAAPG